MKKKGRLCKIYAHRKYDLSDYFNASETDWTLTQLIQSGYSQDILSVSNPFQMVWRSNTRNHIEFATSGPVIEL
jgi:hypothetical protein